MNKNYETQKLNDYTHNESETKPYLSSTGVYSIKSRYSKRPYTHAYFIQHNKLVRFNSLTLSLWLNSLQSYGTDKFTVSWTAVLLTNW